MAKKIATKAATKARRTRRTRRTLTNKRKTGKKTNNRIMGSTFQFVPPNVQFLSKVIKSANIKKNDLILFIRSNEDKKNKIPNPFISKWWKKWTVAANANDNENNAISDSIIIPKSNITLWFGLYDISEMADYPYEHLEKLVKRAVSFVENRQQMINRIIIYFDAPLIDNISPVEIVIAKLYESFYRFSYFKTQRLNGNKGSKTKTKKNQKLEIICAPLQSKYRTQLNNIVSDSIISARGKEIGRDLENFPSNYLYPEKYATVVRQLVKSIPKCSSKVFNHRDLIKKGFRTILAVGQGSAHPPAMIELVYRGSGNNKEKPIILIGKGITFDSGGINLKHGDFSDMKMDKTGASVALAVFINLAKLKLKRNIIALLPMAENMPDGSAIRPGDVITSYSGKTVEITNTDAEGRLVLCDALAYAQEKNPQLIIDIATLTGAAERLTNGQSAVYLGNEISRDWRQKLEIAKKNTQEKIFELPLWNDWKPYLHSTIADIKNTAYDAHADIFLSSLFLSYFVDKRVPWIHIDLANNYPDKIKNGSMIYPSARGSSILLLTNLLKNY